MKQYTVAIVDHLHDAQQSQPLDIGIANWGCQYRPLTQAKLAYVRGQGFWLQLHCIETDPKRTYTQPDQPVHKDSCMEAFIDFNPQDPETGYINFETNAHGALWCAVGPQRNQRRFIRQMGIDVPAPTITITPQAWTATILIPLEMLHLVYGKIEFKAGTRLRANFYKCGDLTAQPHFLSWAPIDLPQPDFHAPSFFGELVLQE